MSDDSIDIRSKDFAQALSERYLSYALSTIMARSLPDARDGLKPVHRRLLYAMRQLRLDPNSGYKKAARVVGDVIGKFHPHGDQSVYDALVRLAQDFAARYPLIDGQGNFGNIDGDNAAAMRYTEARLTDLGQSLLDQIDRDAVDFRDTYDGEEQEPIVLPAAFPNLLANGANGIAVGMATSIPPHNLEELASALLWLVAHRDAPEEQALDAILKYITGPDFPTGGVLVESEASIRAAYASGRGSFRLRARWDVETVKGGTYRIIVSEIPYQVQKTRLIERIADLLASKKLPLLGDIRDESSDTIRLILEPRTRTVRPETLMEMLFQHTDLESRISVNMNVLADGLRPEVMSLVQLLRAFLDHRHTVLERLSRHRLAAIARRLETVKGYLVVFANLDQVIAIIRDSDEPHLAMMAVFSLTEAQAEAILNMRLRALRRLDEEGLLTECGGLEEEQKELNLLLKDESQRWQKIAVELRAMRKQFGSRHPRGPRRTIRIDTVQIVPDQAAMIVEREAVTVFCSEQGWIRMIRGHTVQAHEQRYKEGDKSRFALRCYTTDRLILFADNGRFYSLVVEKLPGGRGHGEPLRLMFDIPHPHDLVDIFVAPDGDTTKGETPTSFLLAASDGYGFLVQIMETIAQTRTGKQIMVLGQAAQAVACLPVPASWIPESTEKDPPRSSMAKVGLLGKNGKLLVFNLEEIPNLNRGRGVILQRYAKTGELLAQGLADITLFTPEQGLIWTDENGKPHRVREFQSWQARRATQGNPAPRALLKQGCFKF